MTLKKIYEKNKKDYMKLNNYHTWDLEDCYKIIGGYDDELENDKDKDKDKDKDQDKDQDKDENKVA